MKRLFISSVIAPLSVSFALGQVAETGMDAKLGRYHSALLKRPESKTLFQKFQTGWLAKNSEKSLEEFLKAAADKGGVADKQLFAYFLLQKGKEQEVIAVLTSALEVDKGKDSAQVYLDRANAYSRLLDFDRAVDDVNKALELSGKAGADDRFLLIANKLKGRFLTRQGKTDEAVAHWKDLAKKNPNDQELIEDVIDILIADSLSPSALELAVKLRDNTKDPYKKALRTLRVGDILTKQGERDKALATYVDTLDLSGDGSWLEREIVGQIQSIYKKEDNLNGLVKKFSELVAKYPQRVHIENKLAGVLVELSRFDEAKKIYQNLLKKSPLDDDLRLAYFNMLKESGDLKSARGLIDSMIKRKPDDAQLYLQRAGLSYELKVKADVLGDLANYKKIAKVNALTAVNYASLLNKYGFEKEAIASYKGAVMEYPDSLDTAIASAQYLYGKKQKDEAVKIWSGIAPKVDRDGLIRLLDTLVMNAQGKLAIELVKSNYDKHKTNLPFLGAAIRTAEFVKDDALAIKYAYTQLVLAKKPVEIDQAINMVSRLAVKTKKVGENIKRLRAKDGLSDPEKFLLADLEETSGELVKSDEILAELAKSDKPLNLMQLARVYERRYQLEKAAASIEKLLKVPNEMKAVHLRRLNGIYQRAGNTKQALATIQRWKTLSPNDKNVWLAEVDLLEAVDGPEAALESLRKGAQKFEGDNEIYAKLADLNAASSRHSHASLLYWRLYDESEDMNDRIRWAAELAKSARSQGNMTMLVDELTRRRRNSPKSVAPIMALAEVYRVNNQVEEQRNLLLEATRLRPDDASLLIQVASMDSRNGSNKDAISILRKAQKLDKSGVATRKLASLLMSEGDFEEALEELETAAGKADPRTVEGLVLNLVQQDAIEEAQAYLKKNLVKFPDDWRLQLLENLILYEQGYSKRAAEGALNLFSVNNEIKNLKLGWNADNMNQNQVMLMMVSEPIPDKYAKLGRVSQASHYISALTQSQNQNRYGGGARYGGGQGSSSMLPVNLKTLHLMANSLFFKALDDLGEKDQKDLLAQADKAGIDNPELMFELYSLATNRNGNGNQRRRYVNFFSDQIKKDPENKDYYNYLVVSKLSSGKFVLPRALLVKARELNKGADDAFIRSFLELFTAEELNGEERSEQLLVQINKDGKLEDRELMLLAMHNRQVFNTFGSGERQEINPGVMAAFKRYYAEHKDEKVVNPYMQRGVSKNQMRGQMIYVITELLQAELFKGDDYKAIIAAIESEDAGIQNIYGGGYRRSSFGYPGRGFNQGRNRLPLTSSLTTVVQSQLMYFSNNRNSGRGGRTLDKAKVKASLDFFKNPILKIIAIRYADEKRDVIPLLEIAKKDSKTKADAYLMHAHLLAEAKKPASEVLAQLNLARQHTLNKDQRTAINAAVLYAGLDMGKEDFDKLDDELKESIRVSSRRLMISRKITSAEEIQKIIRNFSMEKEQARFLNKNKTSARNQLASRGAAVGGLAGMNMNTGQSSGNKNAFTVKLKKAIAMKQTDRAANLAYQKFRGMLKQSHHSSWELEQFAKEMKRLNLSKALLEKMDPQDSVSPRKWLNYYEAGKMLGDVKVQKAAIDYLSGLAVIPKRARTAIALAIYTTEREKAIELLKGASGGAEEILTRLYQDLAKNSKTPKAYIGSLEFINHYISNLGEKTSEAVSSTHYVQQILEKCGAMKRAGKNNGYSSFAVIDKKNKDLIGRRDKACDVFTRSAMKSKQAADIAFKMYFKELPKDKKINDAVIAMVKDSLLVTAKIQNYSGSYSSSSQNAYDKYPDRATYLAQAVSFKKDNALLDDAFLAKIKPLNVKLHDRLQSYKKLLLVSSDSILKEMAVLKKDAKLTDFTSWLNLLSAKSDQKLELQFAEYFMAYLKDSNEKINFRSRQGVLEEVNKLIDFSMSTLYENKKQKVLLDYIDVVSAKIVKGMKQDKFSAWAEIISNSRYIPASMEEYVIASVMSQLMKNAASLADGIKLAQEYQYPIGLAERFSSNDIKTQSYRYERLLAAGYLNSVEGMKFTKMPSYDFDESKIPASSSVISNLGGLKLAMQKLNSIRGHKMSYDVQYLAKTYENYGHYSSNNEDMKTLVSKLQKAPKENKYGAAVFLTVMKKKSFASFIKEHAPSLRKASKEHLTALRVIFKIDSSASNQAVLKSNKIEDLFPIDRAAIKDKANKESVAFLARKKPFLRGDLDEANRFVKKFIKDNVANDLEQTSKVVNHYAMLLDQSRTVLASRYRMSNMPSSPLHEVLINNTMSSFKGDEEVNPFYLLRLVYHLDQLPIRNKLNIGKLIKATIPLKWPFQKKYKKDKRKHHEKVKIILIEQAGLYNTLTDNEEKAFMKAAWWVYFSGDSYYDKLYFNLADRQKLVEILKSQNPNLEQFMDMIDKARLFEVRWFKVLYNFRKQFNIKYKMLNNLWYFFEGSGSVMFKSEMDSLPVRYRCIVLNNIMNLISGRDVVARSSKFRDIFVDTYEEAIKEDPDLGFSDDTRYMNTMSMARGNKFSEKHRQRLSTIGKSNLEKQIQYINAGNMIHQNHFANNCALLAMTDKGKQELLAIYKAEPKHFKHALPIAKLFLKCGFVEQIPNILPDLKNGRYRTLTGSVFLNEYYHADANTAEHVQKLLKLYNTNREKALILFFVGLEQYKSFKNDYDPDEFDFHKAGAEFANKAYQEADVEDLDNVLPPIFKSISIPAAGKLDAFYKDGATLVSQYLKDLESSNGIVYENRVKFRVYIMHLYAKGKYDTLLKIAESVHKTAVKTATKENGSRGKKVISRNAVKCFESVLNIGYIHMYDLYALGALKGGKDDKLKKLLPLIRKYNTLASSVSGSYQFLNIHNNRRFEIWHPLACHRQLSKLIHVDVGEGKAYTNWFKGLNPKDKRQMQPRKKFPLNCYLKSFEFHINDFGIKRKHIPLFKRLFNSEAYQRYVAGNQPSTEHLAIAMDHSMMSSQQVVDLYNLIEIDYKVPGFEAAKFGDLAHAYHRLEQYDKIVPLYNRMNEILVKNPPRNQGVLAITYYHQMRHLWSIEEPEKALKVMPEGLEAKLDKKTKKEYDKTIVEINESLKENANKK